MKDWDWRRTEDGSWTLVHPQHGQACHSSSGAWTESLERFAAACELREFVRSGLDELRILDVGFGLGLNVAAALSAVAAAASPAASASAPRLRIESFEVSRAVLERTAARREPIGPPACERWHAPLRGLLARALARSNAECPVQELELGGKIEGVELRLRLHLGDARERVAHVPADFAAQAVFLDPFSPGIEPALWGERFLAELARRTAPEGLLSTYTIARRVRAALAGAGFRVGSGPPVGAKREGTLASPTRALPALPAKHAHLMAPDGPGEPPGTPPACPPELPGAHLVRTKVPPTRPPAFRDGAG